ncbi:MAG: butyrate kinase [Dictyoglomaceae bacterium]
MEKFYILCINPGSTSTKLAVFENENLLFQENSSHKLEELKRFKRVIEQYEMRKKAIIDFLNKNNFPFEKLSALGCRGGTLYPLPSGTYIINEKMVEDCKTSKFGEHPANLAPILGYEFSKIYNLKAFIVDPPSTDEMDPIAKYTGLPIFKRKSLFHALNQKAIARKIAKNLSKNYEDLNLIVAHLGGGISIGIHSEGKVIDVNNALDGEGPMTPERAGTLPAGDLVKLCFSGEYELEIFQKMMVGKGGWIAYLGTNDAREVEKKIQEGDKLAEEIVKATAYQIAKFIGSLAPVVKGRIDAIVLTGSLAYYTRLVEDIKERVEFIAPVFVYPGEEEMKALCEGVLRVLKGEEKAKVYTY